MDKHQIDQLLRKYWAGDSSIPEEQILKQYFTGNQIDEQHLIYKPMFTFFEQERNVRLEKSVRIVRENKRSKWMYYGTRAAAVLLVIIATLFLLPTDQTTENNEVVLNDSYEDPELAYQEVERALYYLSAQLNRGVRPAAIGMEKMKTIDEILKY